MEEESEANPLIILVVFLLVVGAWRNAWVGNLLSNIGGQSVGDGESGVDPAVGVHHVLRDVLVHNAVDGIPNVLARSHQQTRGDQKYNRRLHIRSFYYNIKQGDDLIPKLLFLKKCATL